MCYFADDGVAAPAFGPPPFEELDEPEPEEPEDDDPFDDDDDGVEEDEDDESELLLDEDSEAAGLSADLPSGEPFGLSVLTLPARESFR